MSNWRKKVRLWLLNTKSRLLWLYSFVTFLSTTEVSGINQNGQADKRSQTTNASSLNTACFKRRTSKSSYVGVGAALIMWQKFIQKLCSLKFCLEWCFFSCCNDRKKKNIFLILVRKSGCCSCNVRRFSASPSVVMCNQLMWKETISTKVFAVVGYNNVFVQLHRGYAFSLDTVCERHPRILFPLQKP